MRLLLRLWLCSSKREEVMPVQHKSLHVRTAL